MASTPESNQPRAQDQPQPPESGQLRATTDHNPPPAGGTYPPSNMSYAHPQHGYPATMPPPYQGYPPNAYNPYYGADPYYATATNSQSNEAASSFARCFCIIMFLLLTLSLVAAIIMIVVVRPDNPVFKVESFTVSNFNLVPVNKMVSGKWEATIFVENPSYRLRLYVDRWETSLYHKDNYLSTGSFTHSMTLDTRSKGTMHLKMETYNSTASGAVEDMDKEQKEGGNVSFNLRLSLLYTMRNGWWYHNYRSGSLRVKCSDLKIGLPVGANTGSMPSGNSKGCDISDS